MDERKQRSFDPLQKTISGDKGASKVALKEVPAEILKDHQKEAQNGDRNRYLKGSLKEDPNGNPKEYPEGNRKGDSKRGSKGDLKGVQKRDSKEDPNGNPNGYPKGDRKEDSKGDSKRAPKTASGGLRVSGSSSMGGTESEKKKRASRPDSSRKMVNSSKREKSSSNHLKETELDDILDALEGIHIHDDVNGCQDTKYDRKEELRGQKCDLRSRGPTGGTPRRPKYVEDQKDHRTVVNKNLGRKSKIVESRSINYEQPKKYSKETHVDLTTCSPVMNTLPLMTFPSTLMAFPSTSRFQGQASSVESTFTSSGDSDLSSLPQISAEDAKELLGFSYTNSIKDEEEDGVTLDWMQALNDTIEGHAALDNILCNFNGISDFRNDGLTPEVISDDPVYIDMPWVPRVPPIDYENTRFLPPIKELQKTPKMESNTTGGSKISSINQVEVLIPSVSPESLKSMKALRYVAGLSTEEILRPDEEGDTILHLAILKEEKSLVDALILRFERDGILSDVINLKNASNQTPLCMAVYSNLSSVVAQLISLGADVNVQVQPTAQTGTKTRRRYGVLHFAVAGGDEWLQTVIELLKVKNIDLDALNSEGRSAMHVAIEAHGRRSGKKQLIDSKKIIQCLANRGANLNVQDTSNGKTPLHYVLEKKNLEFLRWFLGLVSSCQSGSLQGPDRSGSVGFDSSHNCNLQEILNARSLCGNYSLEMVRSLSMDQKEKELIIELLVRNGAQTGSGKKNAKKSIKTVTDTAR